MRRDSLTRSAPPNFRRLTSKPWLQMLLLTLALASLAARAADPLASILYTVGTSAQASGGQSWAYVLWASADLDALIGQTAAVYSKPGPAGANLPYARQATLQMEMDSATIARLLQRAETLGASSLQLASDIDSLFGQLRLPASAPLADKLAVVLRSASSDRKLYQRLLLLGRIHPAITFCLGLGYSQPIGPGDTTFEVRRLDVFGNVEGVIGRVTVTAGSPVILPAPNRPAEVVPLPAQKVLGHLNAQLHWSLPDELKRLSLLSQGVNLYRVTRAYAEAQGWQQSAPPRGRLAALAAQPLAPGIDPDVKRVNGVPLFTPADTSDATVALAEDDNDVMGGGRRLRNGEEFYYFLTARDILGRDGDTSLGVHILICDRVMPHAPTRIQVDNTLVPGPTGVSQQALRVQWDANLDAGDIITRYHVYRWPDSTRSITDQLPPDGSPNRIGVVVPRAGETHWAFIDSGAGAPSMPQDSGRTFFYTVRAQDDGACGGNVSPHSGPMFGVLRDREGPAPSSGQLLYTVCLPVVQPAGIGNVEIAGTDPGLAFFRLIGSRESEFIRAIEFYQGNTSPSAQIARHVFALSETQFQFTWPITRSTAGAGPFTFYCRAEAADGTLSAFTAEAGPLPSVSALTQLSFRALQNCKLGPNGTFDPRPPGFTTNQCVTIAVTPSTNTSEVRVYRRTDGGELTLVAVTGSGPTNVQDCLAPGVAAQACYYTQGLDQNGNSSALTPIGDCITVHGTEQLPTPFLLPLLSDGDSSSPRMRVRWVCPPYGLARFRVDLATGSGDPVDGPISALLGPRRGEESGVTIHSGGVDRPATFGEFETATVGGAIGSGPQFELVASVDRNREYFVFVRAVSLDGTVGPRSNLGSFRWGPNGAGGPEVPWPKWPLTDAVAPLPTIRALALASDEYPVGVRIGAWPRPPGTQTEVGTFPGKVNPSSYLYPQADNGPLLPIALYRYQVPNAAFPMVSGDIVQASPLIDQLAYDQQPLPSGATQTVLRDPFIEVTRPPGDAADSIVLRDTQPIVTGARYVYLVVRFHPQSHEILQTIPTNEIEP